MISLASLEKLWKSSQKDNWRCLPLWDNYLALESYSCRIRTGSYRYNLLLCLSTFSSLGSSFDFPHRPRSCMRAVGTHLEVSDLTPKGCTTVSWPHPLRRPWEQETTCRTAGCKTWSKKHFSGNLDEVHWLSFICVKSMHLFLEICMDIDPTCTTSTTFWIFQKQNPNNLQESPSNKTRKAMTAWDWKVSKISGDCPTWSTSSWTTLARKPLEKTTMWWFYDFRLMTSHLMTQLL